MKTFITSLSYAGAARHRLMKGCLCGKPARGSSRGGSPVEGQANPGLSERVMMRLLGGL